MKKNVMRLLTLMLIVLFTQSVVAQNQQRKSREERQKEARTEMIKDLKLSKEQVKKYDAANKKFQETMKKVRDSGDRESMREKMQENNKKRDAEYKKIFDKKQYEKYVKKQKERNKSRQGRGSGRGIR